MMTFFARGRRWLLAVLFLPLAHGMVEISGDYWLAPAVFGIRVCGVTDTGGMFNSLMPYCHDDADLLRIVRGRR
jgi:hypothetical protein